MSAHEHRRQATLISVTIAFATMLEDASMFRAVNNVQASRQPIFRLLLFRERATMCVLARAFK